MPPLQNSAEPRTSMRNPVLLAPPWITRSRSRSAQMRRLLASSRVPPVAITFATSESNTGGTRLPAAMPVSTRMPGPSAGSKRAMRPGEGTTPASGRWGLFDQFLVAALDGTVPRAEGLHMAAHVGGDLDLDVPRAGDLALEEQASVAERRQCLRGCRAECRRQRRGVLDHADTAS